MVTAAANPCITEVDPADDSRRWKELGWNTGSRLQNLLTTVFHPIIHSENNNQQDWLTAQSQKNRLILSTNAVSLMLENLQKLKRAILAL